MLETLHEPQTIPGERTKVQADHIKRAFGEAVDDLCDKWIDAVKHGRRAKDDLIEDCNYAVKKRPLTSVGGGVLFGLLLGGLIGYAVSRRP